MFGRRKDMRKKNIARAGAAFVLLLALTGVTIFGQDTETTSRAETPRKVANVTKTKNIKKSNLENPEKKSEEKPSDGASSKVEKEKQSENNKQETANASATATENKSESNSSKSNSNSENKNQNTSEKPSSGNSSSAKPSHNHNWIAQKTTVQHPETGHNEQVLVKEAWTEKIPIYENDERSICNACGADITGNEVAHVKNHMLNGENGGFHSKWESVLTGYNEIYHEAEYTTKWVVDNPAWSEEVVTGYTCKCGAKK
ncbi:hypothetical protein CLONEX_02648 [[Clostridium] nexile DSM 1787]|nr:hypothetical protein CLONEX_02648 [[Clostridium] nexile DSM 1787]